MKPTAFLSGATIFVLTTWYAHKFSIIPVYLNSILNDFIAANEVPAGYFQGSADPCADGYGYGASALGYSQTDGHAACRSLYPIFQQAQSQVYYFLPTLVDIELGSADVMFTIDTRCEQKALRVV